MGSSAGNRSKVLAGLVVLELLPLFQLIEQLRVLDLEQREDILKFLADDLLVHLDLGEAIDHIILDALLVELVEVEGEEYDALVLEVLEYVQSVAGDLVDDEDAAEAVHLLLAEVDLLGQHLQQAAEIEIQLLRLLYLVEPLLVDVRQVHVVQVLLRPQLDLYVAQGFAAVERHYADLHHLLEALHLAAAHLTPHLDRKTRLEEGHPVPALHYRVQVGHPSVLALVAQLIHSINLSNNQHTEQNSGQRCNVADGILTLLGWLAGCLDNNKQIKMQFGPLSSRQAIDKRFKELRTQSRQELLSQIYGKNSQKTEATIEKELSQAFSAIIHSYDFDKANPVVLQIAQLFGLNLDSIRKMEPEQRQRLMQDIIQNKIEEALKIVQRPKEEEAMTRSTINDAQENHFQWLGLRTKYTELRPIFQQILLEKVKLFDSQLTRLTEYTESLPSNTIEIATTARDGLDAAKLSARSKTLESTARARKVQSDIEQQFCNVKIRDKSEFLLKRWTQREEESFLAKKAVFKSNLKINNIPVLFQFVKKYTETVKARDNIYRKWQQREKAGITAEEVRYLCATSLFLNNSLARSEKRRIKSNVQSAGSHLISKLETNIAEKIIETYHQLMKRVADLRAKYYEELTQMRKQEQKTAARADEAEARKGRKREVLVKYKAMFERIVNSERMRLKLNERVYKWVRLFVSKLKQAVNRPAPAHSQSEQVFKRLTQPKAEATLLNKLKLKYPSSKIIKREDQYSHRLKYRVYIPSERFHYERAFEDSISKLNRLRLDSSHRSHFHRQISGGPKRQEKYVVVDLSKKQVYMSSPTLIKHIVAIQAKWRAFFTQKRFAVLLEESREARRRQFAEKLESLKRLYPAGRRIDVRAIEGRLRRVNMKISNILQPYVRVARRPINSYTSFCVNRLSASELKSKHARNGKIRLGEFMKMVEGNQYALLKRSGIVVSSREINDCIMGRGANAMWWAVYHSNYELARLFLEGGGDANSKDAEGDTCLHVAVRNGDVQIIFLLLDYGADLNRRNGKKSTCLMHATKKMLKLLGLEEGGLTGERDNNALFYRRTHNEDPYPDHYY